MDQPFAVTVGAKRTMEYVLSCLSLFNRGAEELDLVAVGDCTSKAAEVYRILSAGFGTTLAAADIRPLCYGESEAVFTCSSFHLRYGSSIGDLADQHSLTASESQFVSFPVYQLLFDHLLASQGQIVIGTLNARSLLRITPAPGGFNCRGGEDLDRVFDERPQGERKKPPRDHVTEALYRTGFLLSERWRDLAGKLGQYDDVVLGLDTNILYDCVVTQQILDSLTFTCQANASPNWILLVVPSTVMHELEQSANSRGEKGHLNYIGRKGYRALQEILELDLAKDIRGVSLLVTGETDSVLDARVELRALRDDFKRAAPKEIVFSPKASFGDTLIRDQFKGFLRQLSFRFHKGAFFLTGDKSNSALGQAEGLHSLYVPPVHANGKRSISSGGDLAPPHIRYGKDGEQSLPMSLPVGKLIYELAVQFGSIVVSWNGSSIQVRCDSRGDSLEHWLQRELIIDPPDLRKLFTLYQQSARVSLEQAEAAWKKENKMAMTW